MELGGQNLLLLLLLYFSQLIVELENLHSVEVQHSKADLEEPNATDTTQNIYVWISQRFGANLKKSISQFACFVKLKAIKNKILVTGSVKQIKTNTVVKL